MLGVAARVRDERTQQHKGKIFVSSEQNIVAGQLTLACKTASDTYTTHKVTPEIMGFQSTKFNDLLRKENEHFQVDLFYNPITDYMVEHYEVPTSGDDDSSDSSCVIL